MARVLLADDSPHAQRMGLEILSREGYDVLGLTDGLQVMENLPRFAPDLILADANLPGESGYRICERIKADPAQQHVKVILLVGAVEPFDRAEAERVGADGVLQKPLEPSVVVKAIRPLLGGRPVTPPAAHVQKAAAPSAADKTESGITAESPGQEDFARAVRQALSDEDHGVHVDPERVRAAVVLAVESALPALMDDLTERVLAALRKSKP
ncbi:MAG: response regulator [Acidobacteria bacterium]|nr:response regulator [Acidobacteriota bacterium]